jgi:hypothetical protein
MIILRIVTIISIIVICYIIFVLFSYSICRLVEFNWILPFNELDYRKPILYVILI